MAGCQARMGVIWKPNTALSVKLLLNVIEDADQHLKEATDKEEAHQWMLFVTYVTISYVLSLRGSE